MPFLEIDNLSVRFRSSTGGGRAIAVRALDGVSLSLARGESLGVVGESGSGKTTLACAIVRLLGKSGGSIRFEGRDTARLSGETLRQFRKRVQMIFQDPLGSLNPRMTVGATLAEVLAVHALAAGTERAGRVSELLGMVGLHADHAARYPHELSGGQRQRVGIARALAVGPDLLIADEPVSALDVSVQVRILNLLRDLRRRFALTYLIIAHDLAVVRYVCERVVVLYSGRVMECGAAQQILSAPAHPYTEALLAAVPDVRRGLQSRIGRKARTVLRGDRPTPAAQPGGCPFHPRCPHAAEQCRSRAPRPVEVEAGHTSACHLAGQPPRISSSFSASA